jgi:uncharacterized protein YkwD
MRRTHLHKIAFCLAVLVASVLIAPPAPGQAIRPPAKRLALATGVLTELNRIRVNHHLVPLVLNSRLSAAALQHSEEMVEQGYFSHDSLDGSTFATRIERYYGRGSVGENLVWSAPDIGAGRALRLWMASPEHRAAILEPLWREIGVAAVHAVAAPGTYRGLPVTVITTDFGSRS